MADIRFRPPKKSDEKQWKKVEFLFEHGFYFQRIYRMEEPGVYYRVNYPSDLKEAGKFVLTYKTQAIKLSGKVGATNDDKPQNRIRSTGAPPDGL